MRYRQTQIAGLVHLGHPHYDPESGEHLAPTITLCGLESSAWTKSAVRIDRWTARRVGTVCSECDRTAGWEMIRSLGAK